MNKVEELKRKLEISNIKILKLESDLAQSKAEYKVYKKQLKEEFGIDTLEELNEKLEEMKEEREELEESLEEKVNEMEKLLEKLK